MATNTVFCTSRLFYAKMLNLSFFNKFLSKNFVQSNIVSTFAYR